MRPASFALTRTSVLAFALALAAARPAAAQQGNGKGSNTPPPSSTCPAGQVCAMVITPGDSIAPTVTIKPAVDSVHVLPLAGEVDFGDNVGLDRTKLSITLNGTRVDGSMTTTGSGASYVSKGNLTLVAGANTLTRAAVRPQDLSRAQGAARWWVASSALPSMGC